MKLNEEEIYLLNIESGLDEVEKELIESIENDEWQPVANMREELERSKEIAKNTFKKTERMNIRMNKKDMENLKLKAIKEGMPYQTLVSSILYKYLTGQLVEKT